jgi:glutamine synthetase
MFSFITPDTWDSSGQFQATYVWVSKGNIFRSKVYTLQNRPDTSLLDPKQYPIGVFDGSSTGDASVDSSDVYIRPCAVYNDVIEKGVFVLCDLDRPETPRSKLMQLIDNRQAWGSSQCWFGFEQEYFLVPFENERKQDVYHYCNTTADLIPQSHYNLCLEMGVHCTGWNTEVAPNQFEFQILGQGVKAADDLLIARWAIIKLCDMQDRGVFFHPKPFPLYNGSGLHVNFSTPSMRTAPGGWSVILKTIGLLRDKHKEHMSVYGEHNAARMTGLDETSDYNQFSWGVGSRDVSVRVQKRFKQADCGYLEDRRPGANADPYNVCFALVDTCVVDLSGVTNGVLEPMDPSMTVATVATKTI